MENQTKKIAITETQNGYRVEWFTNGGKYMANTEIISIIEFKKLLKKYIIKKYQATEEKANEIAEAKANEMVDYFEKSYELMEI